MRRIVDYGRGPAPRGGDALDKTAIPQYVERCADCDHTQAMHIGSDGTFLTGFMVPCRRAACECKKWAPTWGGWPE